MSGGILKVLKGRGKLYNYNLKKENKYFKSMHWFIFIYVYLCTNSCITLCKPCAPYPYGYLQRPEGIWSPGYDGVTDSCKLVLPVHLSLQSHHDNLFLWSLIYNILRAGIFQSPHLISITIINKVQLTLRFMNI